MYYLVYSSGGSFRFKTDLSLYCSENRLEFFEHVYDSVSNKYIEKIHVFCDCCVLSGITVSDRVTTISLKARATDLKEKLIEAGIEVKDT